MTDRGRGAPGATLDSLRQMLVTFQLRPGERVNEVELARKLGVSRTPLREALQRLVSEDLIVWEHNKGFFCRSLDQKSVNDLYEFRRAVEVFAIRRACERASDEQIDALEQFLLRTGENGAQREREELLHYDERFHETVALLSENQEAIRTLKNINARIYFFRWVDMQGRRAATQREHLAMVTALRARDADRCAELMDKHIARREEQILDVIRQGLAHIYLGEQPVPYHEEALSQ